MAAVNTDLPKNLMEETLKGMQLGKSGWTTPWAMYRMPDGWYLNGDYTYGDKRHGTACLFVERTDTGMKVTIPGDIYYKWGDDVHSCAWGAPLPVEALSIK